MRFDKKMNLGYLLLSIWLIAWGLFALLSLNFPFQNVILGLLAIAAGVVILMKN